MLRVCLLLPEGFAINHAESDDPCAKATIMRSRSFCCCSAGSLLTVVCISLLALVFTPTLLSGATRVWTGNGVNGFWTNSVNWFGKVAPVTSKPGGTPPEDDVQG